MYISSKTPLSILDMVHTCIRCFKRTLQQALVDEPMHKHSPYTHILCTKTLKKVEKQNSYRKKKQRFVDLKKVVGYFVK